MREERQLTEWLRDYRDSLDGLSTPVGVEAKLRAEFRSRRRIPVAPWLLAAGAAAILVLGIWIGRSRPEPPPPPALARLPIVEPMPVPVIVPEPAKEEEVAIVPMRPRVIARAPQPEPRPATVTFVMLPGSDLMPPTQDLQVLRVRIPRTRIQALGWPVNVDRLEERVLAEVVVGNDGVARAVRLVQANQ